MNRYFNRFRRLGWWLQEIRILFFLRQLSLTDVAILEAHFPYYRRLSDLHKQEFRRKLQLVLTSKQFIGRGGISEITPQMEILIGATIVMVTFGWKRIRLPHFSKILIYPNVYYSTTSKGYHKGEVNPKYGIIVISWSNFLEGLLNEEDGVNLGIHEIAHALKLENQIMYNGESEFFDPVVWQRYQVLALPEMNKAKFGVQSVFRPNAGLNEHEFFAVALETFFEKSAQFKVELPELYQILVLLLRQDPLLLGGDQKIV